jgi:VASP tetramerisation domain
METLKQELLVEMRKELQKIKEEIVEGIVLTIDHHKNLPFLTDILRI